LPGADTINTCCAKAHIAHVTMEYRFCGSFMFPNLHFGLANDDDAYKRTDSSSGEEGTVLAPQSDTREASRAVWPAYNSGWLDNTLSDQTAIGPNLDKRHSRTVSQDFVRRRSRKPSQESSNGSLFTSSTSKSRAEENSVSNPYKVPTAEDKRAATKRNNEAPRRRRGRPRIDPVDSTPVEVSYM